MDTFSIAEPLARHSNHSGEVKFSPEGRRLLSVDQFSQAYGVCRSSVFALIKTGELRSIMIGDRRRIRFEDAEDFLARCAAATPARK
jgi:excisionase family DNA binding protein